MGCKTCEIELESHIAKGGTDSLAQYLATGGDPNWECSQRSLLKVAANFGNVSAIEILLKAGVNPSAKNGYKRRTVLIELADHWARSSAEIVIETLAGAGADPNLVDDDGITALALAARNGGTKQIAALIKAGANPNILCGGYTALMMADGASVIDALLKGGADPNQRGTFGNTALLCQTNDPKGVELLLQAGADPNAKMEVGTDLFQDGSTALMSAMNPDISGSARVQVIEALLRAGADPTAQSKYGETALMRARFRGRDEAIELLTRRGVIT